MLLARALERGPSLSSVEEHVWVFRRERGHGMWFPWLAGEWMMELVVWGLALGERWLPAVATLAMQMRPFFQYRFEHSP